MILFLTIITVWLLIGCVRLVARYWNWFSETGAHDREIHLYFWFGRGVLVPVLIWVAFNFALAPGHVATVPELIVAKLSGGDWIGLLCRLAMPAAIVAGSFWAAMTLAWLVVHLVVGTESRREIRGAGLMWGLLLSPVVVMILYLGGWYGMGFALLILLVPILYDLLALGAPRKLAPAYTRAIERIKSGNYTAAEMEVIRQLEKREDDFEGWMMLAGLYATRFGDLVEAERTIREVCRQVSTSAEYCNALAQLGEWHLKIGRDPAAARRVWEEICAKYPHSQFADAARRRIKELHASDTAADNESASSVNRPRA